MNVVNQKQKYFPLKCSGVEVESGMKTGKLGRLLTIHYLSKF